MPALAVMLGVRSIVITLWSTIVLAIDLGHWPGSFEGLT
jgi:hypothetical protein